MAKKLKALAEGSRFGEPARRENQGFRQSDLACRSGAFAKAQAEGGKMFESLVQEGEAMQNKARKTAEETLPKSKLKATGTWDKLGSVRGPWRAPCTAWSVPTPRRGFAGQARRRADQGWSRTHRFALTSRAKGRRGGEEGRLTRCLAGCSAGRAAKASRKA